jgi:hypothetical protein
MRTIDNIVSVPSVYRVVASTTLSRRFRRDRSLSGVEGPLGVFISPKDFDFKAFDVEGGHP